jgi:hypothetical protein
MRTAPTHIQGQTHTRRQSVTIPIRPADRSTYDHPTKLDPPSSRPPSHALSQNSLPTIANPSRRRLSCDGIRAYKRGVRAKILEIKSVWERRRVYTTSEDATEMRVVMAELAICKALGEEFMSGRCVAVVESMDRKLAQATGIRERVGAFRAKDVSAEQIREIIEGLREEFKRGPSLLCKRPVREDGSVGKRTVAAITEAEARSHQETLNRLEERKSKR